MKNKIDHWRRCVARWLCKEIIDTQRIDRDFCLNRANQALTEVREVWAKNSAICANVGYKSSTTIIAATTLGGGKVEIIRAHLNNLKEFEALVWSLRNTYGPVEVTFDAPRDAATYLDKRLNKMIRGQL